MCVSTGYIPGWRFLTVDEILHSVELTLAHLMPGIASYTLCAWRDTPVESYLGGFQKTKN